MSSSPRIPSMIMFKSRLRSFEDTWPHGSTHFATPTLLAMSGFFHSPGGQHKDRCICYHCGVALVGWEEEDEPIIEHKVHSPNCPIVRNQDEINRLSRKGTKKDATECDSAGVKASDTILGLNKEIRSNAQKRKLKNLTGTPFFDRLLDKKLKEAAGGEDKALASPSTLDDFPSEFRAFSSAFLSKALLSTFTGNSGREHN